MISLRPIIQWGTRASYHTGASCRRTAETAIGVARQDTLGNVISSPWMTLKAAKPEGEMFLA